MQTPSTRKSIKSVKRAALSLFEHETPKTIKRSLDEMMLATMECQGEDIQSAERFEMYLNLCKLVKAANKLIKSNEPTQ